MIPQSVYYRDVVFVVMVKIRRSWEHFIFIMGMPILVKRYRYTQASQDSQSQKTYHPWSSQANIRVSHWGILCKWDWAVLTRHIKLSFHLRTGAHPSVINYSRYTEKCISINVPWKSCFQHTSHTYPAIQTVLLLLCRTIINSWLSMQYPL